tara:strand:+ start:417 stop:614 length:198 start_codon:yes stop_codon:yes gene_type:complete
MKIEILRSEENSNREVVWTLVVDKVKVYEENEPDFIISIVKGIMWDKTPVTHSRMAEIKESITSK